MFFNQNSAMDEPSQWQDMTTPDASVYWNTAILVLISLAYIPQYYRIISRRSISAVSGWTIALGIVASTTAVGLSILLSGRTLHYCFTHVSGEDSEPTAHDHALGPLQCYVDLAGMLQNVLQWIALIVLGIVYSFIKLRVPRNTTVLGSNAIKHVFSSTFATACLCFFLLYMVSLCIQVELHYPSRRHMANMFGDDLTIFFFGLILAPCIIVSSIVTWIPQLIKTSRMKQAGSLSILSVILQALVQFAMVFQVLAAYSRVVAKDWPMWIVAVTGFVKGCLMVILVFKGISFEKLSQRLKVRSVDDDNEDMSGISEERSDEQSPLLR